MVKGFPDLALEDLAADDKVRALVIRGSGDKAFCSGYDIRSLPTKLSDKELGLLDYLVSNDELESFTYQMAEEIATNAPLALKGTKRVINILLQSTSLDESSAAEAESITEASFLSEDLKEGQLAFLEKRSPRFRGK